MLREQGQAAMPAADHSLFPQILPENHKALLGLSQIKLKNEANNSRWQKLKAGRDSCR